MAINNAGHDELAARVDDLRILWRLNGSADLGDLSVPDEDGTMLDVAVRNSEDGGVLNQYDRRGLAGHGWGIRAAHLTWHQSAEKRSNENSKTPRPVCRNIHRAAPWASVDCSPATERVGAFVPVKSMSIPTTWMLPFIEVPSKVPVKTASAGPSSRTMLMVNLNLSALRDPFKISWVPRFPLNVPESAPSEPMVTSAVDSSAPSGVVYASFHLPVRSPLGGSLDSSGTWIVNLRPSTKTYFIFVFSLNRSPSVMTRLAIFPFSMEPRRSATPKISAGVRVIARSAASGARPASIDFFAAFRTS